MKPNVACKPVSNVPSKLVKHVTCTVNSNKPANSKIVRPVNSSEPVWPVDVRSVNFNKPLQLINFSEPCVPYWCC